MIQRSWFIGLVGLGLVVLGAVSAWLTLRDDGDDVGVRPPVAAVAPATPAARPGPAPAVTPPAAPATVARVVPSFDVVRVNPAGDAVMAGRAAPNAQVRIFDGEREVGRVTADQRGEWVFVPNDPLPSGARELSLTARLGEQEARSEQVVVLVVPDRTVTGQPTMQPLVVATPRERGERIGGSTVLQTPAPASPGGTGSRLSLDVVDYETGGTVVLSGRAAPRSSVQVYVDNRAIGKSTAGDDGRWELTPGDTIPVGTYTLRIDELARDGRVATRIELPFAMADIDVDSPSRVVVQPGDSLWRIARRMHGRGMAYLTIYEANRAQIRDPDLIYPGQVFAVATTN